MINQLTGKLMEDCCQAKTVVMLFSCFREKNSTHPWTHSDFGFLSAAHEKRKKKKILILRAQVLHHGILEIFFIENSRISIHHKIIIKKKNTQYAFSNY